MNYKYTEEELKLLIETSFLSGMIQGAGMVGKTQETLDEDIKESLQTLLLAVSSFKTSN